MTPFARRPSKNDSNGTSPVIVFPLRPIFRMLKTICCCFCLRRKSKVTVAPNSTIQNCGSARILVQTAPGRLISVLLMTATNMESFSRLATSANSRRQRNGRGGENDTKPTTTSDPKTTQFDDSRPVDEIERESESTDQEKGKTMVVVVDVERPKTSDTISSRISLPPLRSGSPVSSARKIKKIKWNLRRRVTTTTQPLEGKLAKSISTNSITTSLVGLDDEKRKKSETPNYQSNRDSWKDEIVTLPGAAETESEKPSDDGVEKKILDFSPCNGPSASNVVLFFIHGVGGNSSVWANQTKFFHEIGYNIVAIDLIGHGHSVAPGPKTAYTFETIKADILAIFDRFSRDKNVIIAHSYGTCFAAVLARERRDRVNHLVLISSGAPVPLDPNDGAFALPTAVLILLRPALSRTFRKLAFISSPKKNDFNSAFGDVKTRVLKRIMQGQRWSDCTYLYHQQIQSSTLLVYGSDDGLVSLDEMLEMRKAIPGSVLEVVDQAAHMVMLEQPAQVNQIIEDFLRKTAADPEEDLLSEDPTETDVEQGGFYGGKRKKMQRPGTATSRTIPPSNVFRIHKHETVVNTSTRVVAVS